MGNSSSAAPQTVTYQQMTPAQQQAMWKQYQASIIKQDKELDHLQKRTTHELQNITNLRKTVSNQYTMMSPFNTSNSLTLMQQQQTDAYAPPSNQQPVGSQSPTQPGSWLSNPFSSQPPVQNPQVPPQNPAIQPQTPGGVPTQPAPLTGALCQSTANGGVCAVTLTAPSGSGCRLFGQPDGNLVIYNTANSPIWSSGTYGQGVAPYKLVLGQRGNLKWLDANNTILWQTNTEGQGVAPYSTSIGANCNAQLTDSTGKSLWSANVSSQ